MAQNAGDGRTEPQTPVYLPQKKSSKYIEDTLAKKNLSEQANKRLYTG